VFTVILTFSCTDDDDDDDDVVVVVVVMKSLKFLHAHALFVSDSEIWR